jgi:hypothetical protein
MILQFDSYVCANFNMSANALRPKRRYSERDLPQISLRIPKNVNSDTRSLTIASEIPIGQNASENPTFGVINP